MAPDYWTLAINGTDDKQFIQQLFTIKQLLATIIFIKLTNSLWLNYPVKYYKSRIQSSKQAVTKQ